MKFSIRVVYKSCQASVSYVKAAIGHNLLRGCKSSPITGLDRSTGFQEVKAPRFLDNRHMKVVGCHPYAPAAFTPQEIFLVLISVRG
jgi:hypothetical protein